MYKAFVKIADVFSKSKRSEIMGKIRSRDTGLEKRAEAMLGGSGIEFEPHPKIFGSPDFIVGSRILLFCDSSFWHGRDWRKSEAQAGGRKQSGLLGGAYTEKPREGQKSHRGAW